MAPRPAAALIFVCVPWHDAQGRPRWDALHASRLQAHVLWEAGQCPIAPLADPWPAASPAWETYLHALVLRCDRIALVQLPGWETNAAVQRVLAWGRAHAIAVTPVPA